MANISDVGIIIRGVGGFYYVATDSGVAECRARGRFRRQSLTPKVGDHVKIIREGPDKGVIDAIEPRKNELVRPPVANLDLLFIVIAPRDPEPNLLVIDRMTAAAAISNIEVVLVINKWDLSQEDEYGPIYKGAGFDVIHACAIDGRGTDEIKKIIKGRTCAFAGGSGVGKSSLINLILPETQMPVGEISRKSGRGRHTTRHVELFFACGGMVADTPGFSALDLERVEPVRKEELERAFVEFAPYLGRCRFTGCSHTCEKGCAVIEAVEGGAIPMSRHRSYITLYDEAKAIKDWERKS